MHQIGIGNVNGFKLLFLHGFMGCKEDWLPLISHLKRDFFCLAIDLPGHGNLPFDGNLLLETEKIFQKIDPKPEFLIGYSMGGRVAFQLNRKYPFKRVIIFSSHPGLSSEEERQKRWLSDRKWIDMLKTAPFSEFITAWYNQPTFSTLIKKKKIFEKILAHRKLQNPDALSAVLQNFSLAVQKKYPIAPNTQFFFGEKDLKYADLYRTLSSFIQVTCISKAGHAIHLEKPKICAEEIRRAISYS
ncbi:MAG: alpha/beta fold hydrolase [Chlamydiae bacterium]|nr:alpha/beta fold hydrolase [Chlamydiota bacterium]